VGGELLGGYDGVGSSDGFWNTKILPNAKTTTNLQQKASENIILLRRRKYIWEKLYIDFL